MGVAVCSEIGIPSEECQVFPGAQAHPRTQHVGACSPVKPSLVMRTLMCMPSLEAVQQRTHELRACGLGSNLAVTSVRYGNQTAVETLLGLPELEGNACLFNITRLLCWGPLLTQ